MSREEKSKFQNTVYTSLVLLFTLCSLFKTDYSTPIPVDFGGYSIGTEISLVVNPETTNSIPFIDSKIDVSEFKNTFIQPVYKTDMHRLLKLKLNRFVFPQFISSQFMYPDFTRLIHIRRTFNICHRSTDSIDPFIS